VVAAAVAVIAAVAGVLWFLLLMLMLQVWPAAVEGHTRCCRC
jgi:hypothetical protein